MKVIAYTALHYGKPYLEWAIRSVIDDVAEFHVIYSAIGSHGHRSDAANPDSRDELYEIARRAAGFKLTWHEGVFPTEGAQRDQIYSLVPDADIIIPVDYDEVWEEGLLWTALDAVNDRPEIHRWRVPFRHYYRSFYWCILHDPAYPHRVYNMRAENRDSEATLDTTLAVNHFGYAIPPAYMRYKWEVHGHKNELRRDVDYFADVYEANRRTDCHPCGSIYWNAEWVQPFIAPDYLPDYMMEHPYAALEVIP